MTKNPVLNALGAFGYILMIVTVMNLTSRLAQKPDNTFLAPLVVLSLFTFSAAVMGYIFCYQPIMLYFDGKKKQAVRLFLQTVMTFGGLTVGVLILLFSGLLS